MKIKKKKGPKAKCSLLFLLSPTILTISNWITIFFRSMIGFGDVQLVLVLYISSVQYSVQVQ